MFIHSTKTFYTLPSPPPNSFQLPWTANPDNFLEPTVSDLVPSSADLQQAFVDLVFLFPKVFWRKIYIYVKIFMILFTLIE